MGRVRVFGSNFFMIVEGNYSKYTYVWTHYFEQTKIIFITCCAVFKQEAVIIVSDSNQKMTKNIKLY